MLVFRSGEASLGKRSITSRSLSQVSDASHQIRKSDVRYLIDRSCLSPVSAQPVEMAFGNRLYTVKTSLDPDLHQYLTSRLDRVNSRYIGIVVMSPETGRVLAMTGFNKVNADENPCLTAAFPAASLFKIITAAAAVEEKGYTHLSRFAFNGSKYTLYKRQLTHANPAHTQFITLQDAFAQSVNPVFGKIGTHYLDRNAVEKMGTAFGFNKDVEFELPWPTSHLTLTDDEYHLAEIASGFNRQTLISPLHGAMIAATVVNRGKPVEPTLIDVIADDTRTCIYQTRPSFLPAAVSPKTAKVLERLMVATVTSGTGRKTFRDQARDTTLSKLDIGGKTGSISNREKDTRFDWFVGFATEKQGTEKIVVAAMVGHGDYIGTRATQYARMAIEYYYKDYFSKKTPNGKNLKG
ncbi:PbpA [Desulfosarcina sp. OttesenSCG-928-A07]|nr:PbpA [Desulfosarcina sp. OttesenSCG-928-G17]MDL2328592.1 PbpA [Desulfosarcina sp. OttesenSCG-928-A07]